MEQRISENLSSSTTSRNETQSSNSDRPIPDDLIVEVFSRVPGKSIARFRCVSKYLASILRRSDFTDLFLTKSLNRPRLLFTLAAKGKLLLYSTPQPHNNPDDNSCPVATPYHTSFPEYVPCDRCTTVCGLVLLRGYCNRKVRVICNPATGEFLTLPKVLLKEKNLPKVKAKSNRTRVAGMYLGYDPIGKQVKVLCMTSSRDKRPNTHQVLTLESGKRVWRTVEGKFHFVERYRIRGEICINGVLYFGAAHRIVSFDFRSEKFSFINTDKDMEVAYYYLTLFNYKGELGIHYRDSNNLVCEELVLWVLEDAGNHKWSKHSYPLSPSCFKIFKYNRFVGMTSTGEFVWTVYDQQSRLFYFSFYSLESETFKRVYIQGLEEFKDQFTTPDTFLDFVENMKFM